MVKITLSNEDQELCKKIASERTRANRSNGIQDQFIGKQDSNVAELDGFAAELAFCRIFHCEPDLSVTPRAGGYDTVLSDGRTVDVKNVNKQYRQFFLNVKKTKANQSTNLYALVTGTFPNYEFRGWIESSELFIPENIKDFGYGPGKEAYSVSETKLKLV